MHNSQFEPFINLKPQFSALVRFLRDRRVLEDTVGRSRSLTGQAISGSGYCGLAAALIAQLLMNQMQCRFHSCTQQHSAEHNHNHNHHHKTSTNLPHL